MTADFGNFVAKNEEKRKNKRWNEHGNSYKISFDNIKGMQLLRTQIQKRFNVHQAQAKLSGF